jgi:octaprenyl-diphosphate synthase
MKTASLLIAAALSGAKSVTDNLTSLNIMKEFGIKLGIAFQIKDDLLDYQTTTLIGKPVGNDIQESKLTLPLIYSLNNSSKKDNNRIRTILRKKKKSNKEINEVQDFVRISGGIIYAENILNNYKNDAKELIYNNFDENNIRNSMINLVNYVVERTK